MLCPPGFIRIEEEIFTILCISLIDTPKKWSTHCNKAGSSKHIGDIHDERLLSVILGKLQEKNMTEVWFPARYFFVTQSIRLTLPQRLNEYLNVSSFTFTYKDKYQGCTYFKIISNSLKYFVDSCDELKANICVYWESSNLIPSICPNGFVMPRYDTNIRKNKCFRLKEAVADNVDDNLMVIDSYRRVGFFNELAVHEGRKINCTFHVNSSSTPIAKLNWEAADGWHQQTQFTNWDRSLSFETWTIKDVVHKLIITNGGEWSFVPEEFINCKAVEIMGEECFERPSLTLNFSELRQELTLTVTHTRCILGDDISLRQRIYCFKEFNNKESYIPIMKRSHTSETTIYRLDAQHKKGYYWCESRGRCS